MRPSFDDVWMELAFSLAKRSTCCRAHVGAVIVSDDNHRVLAIGYNGGGRGMENTCDSTEVGGCGCLHAEENACLKNNVADPARKVLYTTTSPCLMCAKRCLNAGVNEVVYANEYRKIEGIEYLRKAGVKVRQHSIPMAAVVGGTPDDRSGQPS